MSSVSVPAPLLPETHTSGRSALLDFTSTQRELLKSDGPRSPPAFCAKLLYVADTAHWLVYSP